MNEVEQAFRAGFTIGYDSIMPIDIDTAWKMYNGHIYEESACEEMTCEHRKFFGINNCNKYKNPSSCPDFVKIA